MAVKKIELENFKGRTVTHELGKINIIRGRNGSGKTSIRDGLAFVFCGTDSFGVRNPTHLISKDKDSMRVTVLTGKATITRTLSKKGNGMIKVERDGIATNYNQTQFEGLVGRVDTFLSAMIPGYFFELTEAKRQEVLIDVLPKVDRLAILVELMGFEPDAEEKLKYGFHRRPDLVASTVAQDRRSAEAVINQKRGRIAQLSELQKPIEPEVVDLASELASMVALKAQWVEHEKYLKESSARKLKILQVTQENSFREQRRKEIADQLDTLVLKDKPEYSPIDLEEFRSQIKPYPHQPMFFNTIESDHCHTCGQAVSLKMKETTKARNEATLKAITEEKDEIVKFNKELQDKINAAHLVNETQKKAYMDVIENNRRVEAMRKSLEIELAGLALQEVPEEIPAQTPPEPVYSASAHMALTEKQENYKKALAIYEARLSDWKTSADQILALSTEVDTMEKISERYKKMEAALKELPEVETKKQIGVFNTDKILFDGNDAMVSGTPRRMLSTGERMKLDLYFCHELNMRMPKQHGLIFHDDADLISTTNWDFITGGKAWDAEKFQDFLVYVNEEDMTLEIKE